MLRHSSWTLTLHHRAPSKLWTLKRDGGEDKPSVVLNEMVKFEETIKVTYKEEEETEA